MLHLSFGLYVRQIRYMDLKWNPAYLYKLEPFSNDFTMNSCRPNANNLLPFCWWVLMNRFIKQFAQQNLWTDSRIQSISVGFVNNSQEYFWISEHLCCFQMNSQFGLADWSKITPYPSWPEHRSVWIAWITSLSPSHCCFHQKYFPPSIVNREPFPCVPHLAIILHQHLQRAKL